MIFFDNLARLLYISRLYGKGDNFRKQYELLSIVGRELSKPIDIPFKRGIIDNRSDPHPNRDPKTGKFTNKPWKGVKNLKIGVRERIRLSHQIATDFPNLKADGEIYDYFNRNHYYQFSVIEFGSYNFHLKIKIEGNEEYIEKIKKRRKQQ